jgi:hypothetical protein
MSLFVASRKYQTQTRGNVDLDFLYACIGEKIKVITEIYFDQVDIATADNKITFAPDPSVSGRVYNDDLVFFEDGDFLNNCQVGDLILFKHNSIPTEIHTLLEIINGGLGRFDSTFTNSSLGFSSGEYAANITPLKSLIYQFGLGTGGFNSNTDDSLQKFVVNSDDELDTVTITLENVGDLDWQFDSVISEGVDSSLYVTQQRLLITHSTIVSPLFLAGQYDDLYNGIAPDYFKPDNQIKYTSQIDYQKTAYIVSESSSLIPDPVGQFGWFNTKFNGAKSDYLISSLQFKRPDLSFANQLEYTSMEVIFLVESLTGSISANTSLVFGFNYLPSDESFYQKTGRSLEENFCYDSKQFIPNNTPVNGDKFGTPKQIIKNVKGEIVSSSICRITATIDIESGQLPILKQGDLAQYDLWCIVEDTSLTPELSDKSNLLVDVNYIYVQKTKIDLLDAQNVFIEHPYSDPAFGQPTLEIFPVDDVVANTLFTLDYTGLENDGIVIKSVMPQIVLVHDTEADIVLDSYFISTENYPVVGSLPSVQDIDFTADRPYKIESGIRKSITFKRDYPEDSGNVKAWVMNFPFMNRWEYWIKIAGLNQIPESIFDSSLPFKGANHFWNRLINIPGWTCVYRVNFDLEQNGEDFEQSFDYELTSTNYNSNTDWSDCEIKSYDIPTNTELIGGAKKFVYSNQSQKDTLIVASFTKSTGPVPDIMNVAIVLWYETFEGGGITEITRISSIYDVLSTSAWKGIGLLKIVEITKNINIFTGRAILDYSKLPTGQKVTVYARIYEFNNTDVPDGGRITNDNILRATNNDEIRIVN